MTALRNLAKTAGFCLLLSVSAFSQSSGGNPSILNVATAPSGSCFAGLPNQQVVSTGIQYSCQSVVAGIGTWTAIGGSGSFNALTGDATSTSTGGATTVIGLKGTAFCTGFTPTNGQAIELTTASSPDPCWTAATPSYPYPNVTVESFGAVGYATQSLAVAGTDSTSAINACLASLTGGGACLLKNDYYKVTAPIVIGLSNANLIGVTNTSMDAISDQFPAAAPGSVIVSTSASADILDVGGTSTSNNTFGNRIENIMLSRSVLPTGTSNGLYLNFTYGATVANTISQDSVNDYHIHGSGLFGGGGFFNNTGLWGFNSLTETTGTLNCFFVDSVDGTNNPSTYFTNNVCDAQNSVTATMRGMYDYGQVPWDLVSIGFNSAGMSLPIWLEATTSVAAGDIHFIGTVLNGTTGTDITVKNFPIGSLVTFVDSNTEGNSTGPVIDLESSFGISFTEMQANNPGLSATQVVVNGGGSNSFDGVFVSNSTNTFNVTNSNNNRFLAKIYGGPVSGSAYNLVASDGNSFGGTINQAAVGVTLDTNSSGNTGLETIGMSNVTTAFQISSLGTDNPVSLGGGRVVIHTTVNSYTITIPGFPYQNTGLAIACPSLMAPDGPNSTYLAVCAADYPELWMRVNSDSTDNKNWRWIGEPGGQMYFGAINDALSTSLNFLKFTRTGVSSGAVEMVQPVTVDGSLKVNGGSNTVYICSGGTFAGLLAAVSTACTGGTATATGLSIQ